MKLFLFGGAEVALGQVEPELKLIETVIAQTGVTEILHIPFARDPMNTEPQWQGDWFHKYITLPGVQYYNAQDEAVLSKIKQPLILITGGRDSRALLDAINSNQKLLSLIKNASYIAGESAGAKVLGQYARVEGRGMVPGLGIIKNSIIETHYSQRNRQHVLVDEMKETGVRYGIGLDCVTGIEFELNEFPEKFVKIGNGLAQIITTPV